MIVNIWEQCLSDGEIPWVRLKGSLVRLVESQEQVATMGLVDRLDKQYRLEGMLEASKPPLTPQDKKFHYLLFTPFRYPPLMHGSRFGSRFEPSLFYGSQDSVTALTEAAYYRFVFWYGMAVPPPSGYLGTQHTLFGADYETSQGLCLHQPPFDAHQKVLTDPGSYTATQQLGAAMREASVQAFEYASARHGGSGINIALYTHDVFSCASPTFTESWLCETTASTVTYLRSQNTTLHNFNLSQFLVAGALPAPAM